MASRNVTHPDDCPCVTCVQEGDAITHLAVLRPRFRRTFAPSGHGAIVRCSHCSASTTVERESQAQAFTERHRCDGAA